MEKNLIRCQNYLYWVDPGKNLLNFKAKKLKNYIALRNPIKNIIDSEFIESK